LRARLVDQHSENERRNIQHLHSGKRPITYLFYSTTQDFILLVCRVNTKLFTTEKP
jgi:hypothetical protein